MLISSEKKKKLKRNMKATPQIKLKCQKDNMPQA